MRPAVLWVMETKLDATDHRRTQVPAVSVWGKHCVTVVYYDVIGVTFVMHCGVTMHNQGLENSVLSFGQFRVIFWQILRTTEILTEFLR